MTVVTLYKLHSGFSNVSDDWTMDASHADEYRGDYSGEFELPDEYHVGSDQFGRPGIWDMSGRYWDISIHASGRPALVSARGFVGLWPVSRDDQAA